MWAADPGPQTVGPHERILTVGAMTATMRAHVDRTEWAMGTGDVVTCRGAGTPYQDSFGARPDALQAPQPLVSKHLKALRDAGAVMAEAVGQRRVYRLSDDPLPDVVAWVAPYYRQWVASLDRLAAALDEPEEPS